ncbi:hypothetical protein V8C26DRAFT_390169 [Trichoderma gracile]
MGKLLFPPTPAGRRLFWLLLDTRHHRCFVRLWRQLGLHTYVAARQSLGTCGFGNGLPDRSPLHNILYDELVHIWSMKRHGKIHTPSWPFSSMYSKASCRSEGAKKRADVAADRSSRKGSAACSGSDGNSLPSLLAMDSCPVYSPPFFVMSTCLHSWRTQSGIAGTRSTYELDLRALGHHPPVFYVLHWHACQVKLQSEATRQRPICSLFA